MYLYPCICIPGQFLVFRQMYLRNIRLRQRQMYFSMCILGFQLMYFDICIREYVSEYLCPALLHCNTVYTRVMATAFFP